MLWLSTRKWNSLAIKNTTLNLYDFRQITSSLVLKTLDEDAEQGHFRTGLNVSLSPVSRELKPITCLT